MRKGALLVLLSVAVLAYFPHAALAQTGGHGHGNPPASSAGMGSREMSMKKGGTQSVSVEDLRITFEVMDMSEHMAMPGMQGTPQHSASEHSQSHALMVTIQDSASKEIISDAKIRYTITSPSGPKETGKMEWSGDRYTGGFSPKGKGVYQVQLMIDSGGMEREARFTHKM
jgi:hypothetical protein